MSDGINGPHPLSDVQDREPLLRTDAAGARILTVSLRTATAMPTAAATLGAIAPAGSPAAAPCTLSPGPSASTITPPQGLTIRLVDEADRPLPGMCFSVELGLRWPDLPSTVAPLDLGGPRVGVVIVAACDADDGRRDGSLTVGGPLRDVLQDIAAVLVTPVGDDLRSLLDRPALTIDQTRTRLPDALGSRAGGRRLPRVAVSWADLMAGHIRLMGVDCCVRRIETRRSRAGL